MKLKPLFYMYTHISKSIQRILVQFSLIDWPSLWEGVNVCVFEKLIELPKISDLNRFFVVNLSILKSILSGRFYHRIDFIFVQKK